MVLDAAAAKALAAIIFISNHGPEAFEAQLPLQAIDRGGSWLIKGTPYTDVERGVRFCFSHVILRKDTAEVVSIAANARMILTDAQAKHWHQIMSKEQFERISEPRTYFEEGGEYLERNLLLNDIFNGGLVNTPKDAVAYAKIILNESPASAPVPDSALRAEDRAKVWHITKVDPTSGTQTELLTFSRTNGKVLSGAP